MPNKFYSVKTIYKTEPKGKPIQRDKPYKESIALVEERILLVKALNISKAIQKAEIEAKKYAEYDGTVNVYGQKVITTYMGICDAFELYDDPDNNVEVFSSTRIVSKKIKKNKLADLMLGKNETRADLKFRKKFLSR